MDQHLRAMSASQCVGNAPIPSALESFLQGQGKGGHGQGQGQKGNHHNSSSAKAQGLAQAQAHAAQAQGLAQWGGHHGQWGDVYSAAVAAAMVLTLPFSLSLLLL